MVDNTNDGLSTAYRRSGQFRTRRNFIKAGGVGATTLIAGCTGNGNDGGTTGQNGSTNTRQLRFISNFGIYEGHAQADEEMIQEFNDMDNNIEVTMDTVGFADTISKVTQAASGGNPYDIVEAGATNTFWALKNEGLFQPVTDVGEDLGGTDYFIDQFYNEHILNGEVWGLPRIQTGTVAWARKDLYEENGLSLPSGTDAMTWNSFLSAVETLHNPDEGISGDFSPLGDFYFNQIKPWCMARSNGIKITTSDGNPNLNTSKMAEFVDYFDKLYQYTASGAETATSASPQMRLFYNKEVANSWMSTFLLPGNIASNYPDLEGNVRIMPLPTKTKSQDPVVRTTAAHFGVSKNTEHPEAAKEFLRYIFDTDRLIKYMHGQPGATVATVKPILNDDEYRETFLDTDIHDRFGESLIIPYNEITQEYGLSVQATHGTDNLTPASGQLLSELTWLKAMQEVLLNDADTMSALEQAQSNAEDAMEN